MKIVDHMHWLLALRFLFATNIHCIQPFTLSTFLQETMRTAVNRLLWLWLLLFLVCIRRGNVTSFFDQSHSLGRENICYSASLAENSFSDCLGQSDGGNLSSSWQQVLFPEDQGRVVVTIWCHEVCIWFNPLILFPNRFYTVLLFFFLSLPLLGYSFFFFMLLF
jgi:hypothetical protein